MVKKGDLVVQVQPAPIKGQVIGFNIDQETGDRLVLVQWHEGDKDGDGEPDVCRKFFKEDEIKLLEEPVA